MNELANPVTSEATEDLTLDIQEIMRILPHRYPFLLIDRVTHMIRKKRIVAIKNVTCNEPFFAGHFPGFPIMPGVLVVEAIAQAGGALLLTEVPDRDGKLMVFTGIERARFRKPIIPATRFAWRWRSWPGGARPYAWQARPTWAKNCAAKPW